MIFKIDIHIERTIEAKNEQEAVEKFWERLAWDNETPETVMTDYMEIIEVDKNV